MRLNKVIVEYKTPLPAGSVSGYAVQYKMEKYGSYNGLYVIGASKVNALEDKAGTMATPDVYGAYATYADFKDADVDLSAWDGDFWTVVDGVPYPKNLGERNEVNDVLVELGTGETFTVDLSSLAAKLSGTQLEAISVNGKDFAQKSFANDKLTLDTASLGAAGDKTIISFFKAADGRLVVVEINVTVCNLVINNEEELNSLPAKIAENPAGYFVLGNDITCAGAYPAASKTVVFTGVFDGRGHTIYNMKTAGSTSNAKQGMFGDTMKGTVKNVSFIGAEHSGMCGFFGVRCFGTVEDVYIQIKVYNLNTTANNPATSILGSATDANTRFNRVWIEYTEALPTGGTGYPVYWGTIGRGCFNGLYVIGADKVYGNKYATEGTQTDVCGAYMTEQAFREANVDVTSWEGDFWAVVDGVPKPRKLSN